MKNTGFRSVFTTKIQYFLEVYLNKLPTYLLMLDEGQFPTQWGSPSEKKTPTADPKRVRLWALLVEARGVEPLSETIFT
jgi:hypothetical protein